jgi:hypothetical protein
MGESRNQLALSFIIEARAWKSDAHDAGARPPIEMGVPSISANEARLYTTGTIALTSNNDFRRPSNT